MVNDYRKWLKQLVSRGCVNPQNAIFHSFQDVRAPWKGVQLEAEIQGKQQETKSPAAGFDRLQLVVEWRPTKDKLRQLVDGSEKNTISMGIGRPVFEVLL